MNVADEPAHIGLVPVVNGMETVGVTIAETDIVIPFEVAVGVITQARFDVITQETICPSVNDDVVNVGLFVPAFIPFTFH